MVSLHIQYEFQLAGISFMTGAWLMIIYDCLRLFRLLMPHKTWLVGLEDAGYWIYAGLLTFSMLYAQNDGILRWYAITGILVGMILYDRLASRFYLKALKKIIKYITIRLPKKRNGKDGDSSDGRSKAQSKKQKKIPE